MFTEIGDCYTCSPSVQCACIGKTHQGYALSAQDIKTHPEYEKENHKEEGKEYKCL